MLMSPKAVVAGFLAVAGSGWVAVENAAAVAQEAVEIGPSTQVTGMFVFQIATLVAAAVILLRLGALLKDWRDAIDAATKFGVSVTARVARLVLQAAKQAATEKQLAAINLLVQEHETRLGRPGRKADGA